MRRTAETAIALTALVVLSPLLLLIAIAVLIDDPRAPILFRQDRTGLDGHRFRLAKFRTMVRDAEAAKAALRGRSEVAWPDFRLTNDPRVTRVGRLLRRTSLDELPQLWSVVRGDMALVGPRPTSFAADTYAPWQLERLEVRPGLTGPWQVHGRSTMDFEARCRLEISWLRHRTLRGDGLLLLRTAAAVVRRTGAA